jgi:hypothetical protein
MRIIVPQAIAVALLAVALVHGRLSAPIPRTAVVAVDQNDDASSAVPALGADAIKGDRDKAGQPSRRQAPNSRSPPQTETSRATNMIGALTRQASQVLAHPQRIAATPRSLPVASSLLACQRTMLISIESAESPGTAAVILYERSSNSMRRSALDPHNAQDYNIRANAWDENGRLRPCSRRLQRGASHRSE